MRTAVLVCVSALIVCGGFSLQSLAAEEAQPKVITNSIGMKVALIPAGEFMMGSAKSTQQMAAAIKEYSKPWAKLFDAEHPKHRVRITKPFYVGAHEVTVGQFRHFAKATGYKTDAEIPEFKGNVAVVHTETFWEPGLELLQRREIEIRSKANALNKKRLSRERHVEQLLAIKRTIYTEEELKQMVGTPNAAHHYLGCAKTITEIGKAFAEAILEMEKKGSIE